MRPITPDSFLNEKAHQDLVLCPVGEVRADDDDFVPAIVARPVIGNTQASQVRAEHQPLGQAVCPPPG